MQCFQIPISCKRAENDPREVQHHPDIGHLPSFYQIGLCCVVQIVPKMSGMFSKWFGKKPKSSHQSNADYEMHFHNYGAIGEFGGFESHLQKIGSDIKLSISDDKYRKDNRSNVLGPLYANRSLRGHIHPVIHTSWSVSDPTLLVSVGKDARLMTWNTLDASKSAEYHVGGGSDMLMSCSINSSNKLVAAG